MPAELRTLLVGWPLGGWDVLLPLAENGVLPVLARLIAAGSMAHLRTHAATSVDMVATTLVTGASPRDHAILASTEPDPFSGGARTTQSTSRRTPAVWNYAHQAGLESVVVGWPVSHPAEPIRGAVVTPAFPHPTYRPGVIHPESLWSQLQEFRVSPLELDEPNLDFASAVAFTASLHAAADWCLQNLPWRLACVYYPSLLLHPSATPQQTRDLWQMLDAMLGRLLELAGPQATVALVTLLPAAVSRVPLDGDAEDTALLLSGPGVSADSWLPQASIYDICPTLLNSLGLEPPASLPGSVLGPHSHGHPIDATAPDGMHPKPPQQDWQAILQDLETAGYTDPVSPEALRDDVMARRSASYALGCYELFEGDPQLSLPHLVAAARLCPSPAEPHLLLAYLHLRANNLQVARQLLPSFPAGHPLAPYAAWIRAHLGLAEGDHQAAEELSQSAQSAPWGRGLLRTLEGDYHRVSRQWLEAETAYRAALEESPSSLAPATGLAEILLRTGRLREAEQVATRMLRRRPLHPQGHLWLGIARYRMGDHAAAETSLLQAQRLAPQDPRAAAWLKKLRGGAGRAQ